VSPKTTKKLTNIHHNPVTVESHGHFVRVEMGEPARLTVQAALTMAGTLVREAQTAALRYSDGVDAAYLAKCFRDAGFEASPNTTLGDLIRQLED
jgi:hypothetical protein